METAIEKYRQIILNYVSNTLNSAMCSTNLDEPSILRLIEKLNEINKILDLNLFDKINFKKNLDGIECNFSLKTICKQSNFIRWELFFGSPNNFKKEIVESVCYLLLDLEKKETNASNTKS